MADKKGGQGPKKKELFLEGAIRTIQKVGTHQLNSYSVAKELGVSQSSFFYHFETQADFYRELVAHITRINEGIVKELTRGMKTVTAWQKLETYIAGNLLWTEKYPEQFDVLSYGMQHCGHDPKIVELINEAFEGGYKKVYNIVSGGFAEGEFKLALPIQSLVFCLHKAIVGAMFHLQNLPERKNAHVKMQADILLMARRLLT